MTQETLTRQPETGTETIALIAALDANPRTRVTGEVQYEWGTKKGKQLEPLEGGSFTIEDTVTTFGYATEAPTNRIIQQTEVTLMQPPRHIEGVDGHVVGLSYAEITEGLQTSRVRTARVFAGNRVHEVKKVLTTPDEIAEHSTVFTAATQEAQG